MRWAVTIGGLALAVWALWHMRAPAPARLNFPIEEMTPPAAQLSEDYDPSRVGTIEGQVFWDGPAPAVADLEVPPSPLMPAGLKRVPNPNAPRVRAGNLGEAVVYLGPVSLARSKPWSHAAVRVEANDFRLQVYQGDRPVRFGLVRRGDEVTFLSREAAMHSVRARGPKTFFTQMLPEPNRPVARVVADWGYARVFVELSSGSGYYWMRGYLIASNHPYSAIAGVDGTFRLEDVPAGEYELMCWHPNWNVDRVERDPELVLPARLHFHPARVQRLAVKVEAGKATRATFRFTEADFRP